MEQSEARPVPARSRNLTQHSHEPGVFSGVLDLLPRLGYSSLLPSVSFPQQERLLHLASQLLGGILEVCQKEAVQKVQLQPQTALRLCCKLSSQRPALVAGMPLKRQQDKLILLQLQLPDTVQGQPTALTCRSVLCI